MQRLRCFAFILCLLLLAAPVSASDSAADYQQMIVFEIGSRHALVHGERITMEVPVILRNDRSAVPLKYIAEWLGGSAAWDAVERCAVLTFPNAVIRAAIDSAVLTVNGNPVTVDAAPFIYENRTYLSVRTTADLLGKHLSYSGNDKPIFLTDTALSDDTLATLLQTADNLLHPTASLQWPLPGYYKISTIANCDNADCYSHYGGKNGHGALDIPAPAGTAVIASADGVVTFAGCGGSGNAYTGYGNIVLIDHGNGLSTHYAHLTDIAVRVGDRVACGDTVGTVGNTGYATGNHLDFAVWLNGVKTDPLAYLDIPTEAVCYEPCDQPFLDAARAK